MGRRQWEVQGFDKRHASELAAECDIDPFVSLILCARGYGEPYELEEFLSGEFPLSDPHALPGMQEAADRIHAAVEGFEKIAVYGDYDVDGICATAILYSYLAEQNANVIFYIPDRSGEGYGMNIQSVDTLHGEGVTLIVTVDNGISAAKEIAYAKELGIDTVVTDHHLPPDELPEAAALVDPHLKGSACPFPEISGTTVAYKLVCALEGCGCEELLYEYADLVALGTVADIMPLTGENRVFVQKGIKLIYSGHRLGINAILEEASMNGKRLNAATLGFVIGPRINAAGRMGRCERAVRLLLSESEEEAAEIAAEIGTENTRRRQIEVEITENAREIIERDSLKFDRVIVVAGEGWHPGVIGIVASRLMEYYGKPAVVLTVEDGIATGSARSLRGFSIHTAMSYAAELLTVFGGHELAGGLTLPAENIPAFREKIGEYAAGITMPFPKLILDCKINPKYINLDTVYALSPLEPHGSGNPAPQFGLFGMKIERIQEMSGGKHTKLTASREGASLPILCFGVPAAEFPFEVGDIVDLAVKLDVSEYQGQASVSVLFRGIRFSGKDENALLCSIREYDEFRKGNIPPPERLAELIPDREELAAAYRALKGMKKNAVSFEVMSYRMNISYAKLRIILDIMEERGLIACVPLTAESTKFTILKVEGKIDIDQSPILVEMREKSALD